MRAMLAIAALMLRDQRTALMRGAALALVVLLMGAALLGLSGWFITAAAAAGLAGAGTTFDVFRPSAMVRFLAIGRTAARYGERLLTHDATLRALTTLRVHLLRSLLQAPWDRLVRLRAGQMLNRVTADVDALDGLTLRLLLPTLAGLAAHAIAFAALWWLVDLRLALLVVLGYVLGAALVTAGAMRAAGRLARRTESAAQAFRTRLIDLIAARADLAVYGQLTVQTEAVEMAERRRQAAAARLDRADRLAGAALSLVAAAVTAAALWLGGALSADASFSPAIAALVVFVALALAETIAPLRRAITEEGRIIQAARRVARMLGAAGTPPIDRGRTCRGHLLLEGIRISPRPGARPLFENLSLELEPGDTVALAGPSGSGKSTLLLACAGILRPESGQVTLDGASIEQWDTPSLRRAIVLVPQRTRLLQGSIADNLRLAAPDADDEALWAALEAVRLAALVRARGGLDSPLGPRGAGLSGGEARRLALARALLQRPAVLLLDEPTEGLDEETAQKVLQGIRSVLPESALLIAAHRQVELNFAKRSYAIGLSKERLGASHDEKRHF